MLAPAGVVFTSTPLTWHFHAAPTDCYRYYPEAMNALYEGAGLTPLVSVAEHLPHDRKDPLGSDSYSNWGTVASWPKSMQLYSMFSPLWKNGGQPFVMDTVSVAVKPADKTTGATDAQVQAYKALVKNMSEKF